MLHTLRSLLRPASLVDHLQQAAWVELHPVEDLTIAYDPELSILEIVIVQLEEHSVVGPVYFAHPLSWYMNDKHLYLPPNELYSRK